MTDYSILAEAFLEKHERNVKRVVFRMKRYLADPSEENIHDLRTAVRRLEASHAALPKAPRLNKQTSKFVSAYRKFFKASSRARDMDVMMAKLERLGSDPAAAAIIERMADARRASLERGERIAASLERMREPAVSAESVAADRLQKRFNKLILPLLRSVEELLPIVVADGRNVAELHRLRINCKKLRYLLEIIDGDSGGLLSTLRQMQDFLGSIHDSDVMIEFLKSAEPDLDVSRVMASEARRRRRSYRKFVVFVSGMAADKSPSYGR